MQLNLNSFYNTISESGDQLRASESKAKKQEDIILSFFQVNNKNSFTPCEIHSRLNLQCPLTSTRRAITNLTNKGLLVKCDEQRNGIYGKLNYTWMLITNQPE